MYSPQNTERHLDVCLDHLAINSTSRKTAASDILELAEKNDNKRESTLLKGKWAFKFDCYINGHCISAQYLQARGNIKNKLVLAKKLQLNLDPNDISGKTTYFSRVRISRWATVPLTIKIIT